MTRCGCEPACRVAVPASPSESLSRPGLSSLRANPSPSALEGAPPALAHSYPRHPTLRLSTRMGTRLDSEPHFYPLRPAGGLRSRRSSREKVLILRPPAASLTHL